jgi:hypothetical protein
MRLPVGWASAVLPSPSPWHRHISRWARDLGPFGTAFRLTRAATRRRPSAATRSRSCSCGELDLATADRVVPPRRFHSVGHWRVLSVRRQPWRLHLGPVARHSASQAASRRRNHTHRGAANVLIPALLPPAPCHVAARPAKGRSSRPAGTFGPHGCEAGLFGREWLGAGSQIVGVSLVRPSWECALTPISPGNLLRREGCGEPDLYRRLGYCHGHDRAIGAPHPGEPSRRSRRRRRDASAQLNAPRPKGIRSCRTERWTVRRAKGYGPRRNRGVRRPAELPGGTASDPLTEDRAAGYGTAWNSIRYKRVSSSMGPAWAARRRRASRSASPARRTSSSSIEQKGTSSIESTSIQPGPTG